MFFVSLSILFPANIRIIYCRQGSPEERSYQVSIMQHIYRKASRVVIFLGDAADDSHLVFPLCARMATERGDLFLDVCRNWSSLIWQKGKRKEYIESLDTIKEVAQSNSTTKTSEGENSSDEDSSSGESSGEENALVQPSSNPTDDEIEALNYLLDRPWWTRCWVIQEFFLARNAIFMCGDDEIGSDIFFQGMVLATFYADKGFVGRSERLSAALSIYLGRSSFLTNEYPSHGEPLLELLLMFRPRLATDARDKLYGLLGLIGPEQLNSLNIEVDYNLSVEQTYVNCAASILSSMGNLDILATDKPTESSFQGRIPSWVPDWSICTGLPAEPILSTGEDDEEMRFCACGTSDTYNVLFAPSNCLLLSGFVFDDVAIVEQSLTIPKFEMISILRSVNSVWGFLRFIKDIFYGIYHKEEVLLAWLKLGLKYDGPTPYLAIGQDIDMVFRNTLMLGESTKDAEAREAAYKRWKADKRTLWEMMRDLAWDFVGFLRGCHSVHEVLAGVYRSAIDMLKFLVSDEDESDTLEFTNLLSGALDRRMARTQTGYLAMLPAQAKSGDQIVLMKGSKVPLVARRINAKWELVGPAYVHEIMYGEAWRDEACQEMLFL